VWSLLSQAQFFTILSPTAKLLLARLFLFLSVLALSAARAESGGDGSSYQLGRGLAVGDTGIRFGGYASVEAGAPSPGPWEFSVSDLSLFTTWTDHAHWRFFSETEVGEALTAGGNQGLSTRNAHFELERLYIDRLFDDLFSLRFGKFLTPVGRWNLLHASPLTWTTTRPVATYDLFSKHATGLMLHGGFPVLDRRMDYAFYADLTEELDPYRSADPFNNALGSHWLYSAADNLELGLSYVNYQLHDDPSHRFNLVGVEGAWFYRRFELNTEWVYRNGGLQGLYQGFVQGVAPLVSHWYAIGRYEYFDQVQQPAGQLGVFGLAFRPVPPLVWKVEYRIGTHNEISAPDGLYGSFAVLF